MAGVPGFEPGNGGSKGRCPASGFRFLDLAHVSSSLGREDSNLRMAAPKAAALPLGYAPTQRDSGKRNLTAWLHPNDISKHLIAHQGLEEPFAVNSLSPRRVLF